MLLENLKNTKVIPSIDLDIDAAVIVLKFRLLASLLMCEPNKKCAGYFIEACIYTQSIYACSINKK